MVASIFSKGAKASPRVSCSAGFRKHSLILRFLSCRSRTLQDKVEVAQLTPLPPVAAERLEKLEGAWARAFEGWEDSCNRDEYMDLFRPNGSNPMYGELDRFSVARVICGASLTSDDVLVDVGSGLGKLATLAVTLTNAKEAWGLELSTSRHAAAIEGADEMTRAGLLEEEERGRLRFWQGDCGEGGVALPPQVLGATVFLLTLKDGRASVHSLLARLAACQTHTGEDRVLWSVAHPLPLQGGLQYKNTFQVPGYSKVSDAPLNGPASRPESHAHSTREWRQTKDFLLFEYRLPSASASASSRPAA